MKNKVNCKKKYLRNTYKRCTLGQVKVTFINVYIICLILLSFSRVFVTFIGCWYIIIS